MLRSYNPPTLLLEPGYTSRSVAPTAAASDGGAQITLASARLACDEADRLGIPLAIDPITAERLRRANGDAIARLAPIARGEV